MSTVLSTNMNLPVPVVGQEPGPDYATDINACMNILDAHTHTAGSGVQITPAAMNINSTLAFNNNFANTVAGVTYSPQISTPATGTTYVNGADLYYIDTIGNVVRITQSGAVAGTPGSIANLVPPASATYVSGSQTFVWQSGTNIAANLDAGALLMRNLAPNSTFALTLQPPAALGNNYSITLPVLPASQKIMTLDNAGIMSAPYSVDGTTVVITSNVISVGTIVNANIANGTITAAKLANPIPHPISVTVITSTTFTVPANVNQLMVEGCGGGGGGGGGSSAILDNVTNGGGGGGGGAAAVPRFYTIDVTPGQVFNITPGGGGAGGASAPGNNPGDPGAGNPSGVVGSDGAKGGATLMQISGSSKPAWVFPGGNGGGGGGLGIAHTNAPAGGNGANTVDGYGFGGGGAGATGAQAGAGGTGFGGGGSGGGGGGRGTAGASNNGGSEAGPAVGGVGTGNATSQTNPTVVANGPYAGCGGGGAGGTCQSPSGGTGGTGGLGGQYLDGVSVAFLVHSTNGSAGVLGAGGGGGGGQGSVTGATIGGAGGGGGNGFVVISYLSL